MVHKLEVLSRPPGAPRVAPRVVASAGMSLRFKIPSSHAFRGPAASSGAKMAPVASATQEEEEQKEKVADELSWDERDWEKHAEGVETSAVHGGEKDEVRGKPVDDWEESAAPDLPDDFPRLILNLSKLQRQHFPDEDLANTDIGEFVATVKTALRRHFTHMVEALFDQQSCFHCTYGTSRAMLDGLHTAYPNDVFALIDYPTEIDGIALHEYMHILSRESLWKSVDYLKDCLRRCSRDIKWKMDVALELELLAEREHDRFTTERQQLSDEIDDLTRLRDSFQEKLAKLQKSNAPTHGSSFMLLRKVEDIENRLLTLVDEFLKEPELEEHECDAIFGSGDGQQPTAGMNVLDMVVAMIFGRLPRDFSKSPSSEEHFQMLFDHHIHIRRLWKRDFGRLPPRSQMPDLEDDNSELDPRHEEQVTSDNELPLYSDPYADPYADTADYHNEYALNDEQAEAIALGQALNGSLKITGNAPSHASGSLSSKLDDWEAINIDEEPGLVEAAPAHHSQVRGEMDGYGADLDSDESEDEPDSDTDFVSVPKVPAVTSSAPDDSASASPRRALTNTSETLVRRHRHRALPGERTNIDQEKKSKPKKKKSKVSSSRRSRGQAQTSEAIEPKQHKSRKHKQVEEERPFFQPFACTGAVGLLQMAKDNEMLF